MPLSFFRFCQLLSSVDALPQVLFLTLAVLLVNGWTDAPNAIAGAVVTGALSFRRAAVLAAFFNFLGVLCVTMVNSSVAETVYSIAAFRAGPSAALTALCAALAAIVLWAAAAWLFGIPTSESHALLAGITGGAVALEGSLSCIRWACLGRVVVGLVFSVAAGYLGGKAVSARLTGTSASPALFRRAQIPGAALLAFLHGAQDGQKFLGIFLLGLSLSRGGTGEYRAPIPLWLMVLCALAMALGTLMGGRRIIDRVGHDMVTLSPRDGLAADLGCALGLAVSTALGLPVSTTHARTAAILGAGSAHRGQTDRTVVRQIFLAWGLTFPGCALIGWVMARFFLQTM